MNNLEAFCKGCKYGIVLRYERYQHKIPMWLCWIISIFFVPVNILCAIAALIVAKKFLQDLGQDAIDYFNEEEEAE